MIQFVEVWVRMRLKMMFQATENLHFSCCGHTHPLMLQKFLLPRTPVDQMGTNDCRHVVNSRSNCKHSKVVTGQAFIAWLNCINFLFLFTLNCSIFLHEVLYLLGCVRYCGYFCVTH